jgi:tRNA nucleotidyltransferase (CCA-adding enzyme)
MFFHDIGKPPMFTLDDNGTGHFKGHAPLSAEMSLDIMKRLRYDTHTIERTCRLIGMHSDKIKDEVQLKKKLSELGLEDFCKLMEFKKADNCAKNEFIQADNEIFDSYIGTARRLVRENACLSLRQLAVNGSDIAALGVSGKDIGQVLAKLLDLVIEGSLTNDRDTLLSYAGRELIC